MRKYLVSGGSGKLSKEVIKFLLEDFNIAPNNIVTTTRDVNKLDDLVKLGVDVREANFDDEASLQKAFDGATKLLLVSTNEIGKRLTQHTNAIKAAQAVGVKHLVYTSMPNAEISPITFAGEHSETEEFLRNSEISSYTILRNNWYFENFIEFQADMFKTAHWLNATKEGKVSYLSRVDLAYGAAFALVKKQDVKEVLTLGAESLSIDEMIVSMKEVLNKDIQNVNVSLEQFSEQLLSFGLPKDLVDMLASFEEHNEKNLSDISSKDFEQLTSKKAKTFKAWLEQNKQVIENL